MPIRLKDDAITQLAALDERFRKPNGQPHHGRILSASGVGKSQWSRIRRGEQSPGAETVPKLIDLARQTGLSEQEAYALLFTTEPREQPSAA